MSSRSLILFLLIFVKGTLLFSQRVQEIEYNFRLFNEQGQKLSSDSLIHDNIFVLPNPGRILHSSYNDTTKFFSVKIKTTWPILRIIWNHHNQIMEFSLDHRTTGKIIFLDSLTFNPGLFYIADDDEKSWWNGLNILIKEDETSIHILKFHFNDFITNESYINDRKLKKVKIK